MQSSKHTTNRFTPKFNIKKGDKVAIIAGSNKGKEGVVREVLADKNAALIENLNLVKKHVKPSNNSQGGIVDIEAPINLSNLMLIDPKTSKPTRVGRKSVDGKSVRVSVKSGEIIK
jgi:large subunit ribosomal protein L24